MAESLTFTSEAPMLTLAIAWRPVGFFGLGLVLLLAHNGEVVVVQGSVDLFWRETGQPPKIRKREGIV